MATTTSERMTILYRVLLVAPNGLPQYVSVRSGTEHEAIHTAMRHRPSWAVARDDYGNPIVEREKQP